MQQYGNGCSPSERFVHFIIAAIVGSPFEGVSERNFSSRVKSNSNRDAKIAKWLLVWRERDLWIAVSC